MLHGARLLLEFRLVSSHDEGLLGVDAVKALGFTGPDPGPCVRGPSRGSVLGPLVGWFPCWFGARLCVLHEVLHEVLREPKLLLGEWLVVVELWSRGVAELWSCGAVELCSRGAVGLWSRGNV